MRIRWTLDQLTYSLHILGKSRHDHYLMLASYIVSIHTDYNCDTYNLIYHIHVYYQL